MVVSLFVILFKLTCRAASPLPQCNLCNGPHTPNWQGGIKSNDRKIQTLGKETCTSSRTCPLPVRAITFTNTRSELLWYNTNIHKRIYQLSLLEKHKYMFRDVLLKIQYNNKHMDIWLYINLLGCNSER